MTALILGLGLLTAGTGWGAASISITVSVIGDAKDPDLEEFLVARAQETWDVGEGPEFAVTIAWLSADELEILIAQGPEALARRTLSPRDPAATKASLWLLVRSTINRAVDSLAAPPPTPEPREAMIAPPTAPPAAVEEAPSSPSYSRSDLEVLALLTTSLEIPKLMSVGVAAGVGLRLWRDLIVSLRLGYSLTPGPDGLTVHHLPLALALGWQLGRAAAANLGVEVLGELKWAVTDDRDRAVFGASFGPYAQLRVPMGEEAGLLLRLGLGARIRGHRYLYDGGEATEHPWVASLAVGANFQ